MITRLQLYADELRFLAALCACFMVLGFFAAVAPAQESQAIEGWPREYAQDGDTLVIHQPQLRDWEGYTHIRVMAAVEVTPAGAKEGTFGALYVDADTETDLETRMVAFSNVTIADVSFPNVEEAVATRCSEVVRTILSPRTPVPIALDRLVAAMEGSEQEAPSVDVNLAPPPIYYSDKPAIIVIFLGEPRFEAAADSGLLFAVNTNWDVFLDTAAATYYMLNDESWLSTKDVLAGPWTSAASAPAALATLPDDDNWSDVKANVPGKAADVIPAVFATTEPAELIVTDGTPSYSPIQGTSLLYAANTDSDVFLNPGEGTYYFLTAGRWFRAKDLKGPWSAASGDLPGDFAKIPEDHAKGYVLASVPGTSEAQAAVILASVPQKATVDRQATTVTVAYDGEPNFVIVDGTTTVYYAVNTPQTVFRVAGAYYCCYQGVWFVATGPAGPWTVATSVPSDIYKIPPTHPTHNVTYVYIYDSTPETVVVGYTSGYSGSYVAATGVLMFGLGYIIGHDDDHHHYHYHHAHYYSYGCGAVYHHGHGGYVRAGRYYGPYGGAGRYAAYNPSTGTYSRGAARYGPHGSAYAQRAYNPHTGRGAARAGGSSPYGSWSRGVVRDGDDWARGGRQTNWKGTVVGGRTSEGGAVVGGRNRLTGDTGFIGKSGEGDLYAGHNGNVYKRDADGNWQSRSRNSWDDVPRTQSAVGTADTTRDTRRAVTTSDRRATTSRTLGGTSPSTFDRSRSTSFGQLSRDSSARQSGNRRTSSFRSSSSTRSTRSSRSSGGGRRR